MKAKKSEKANLENKRGLYFQLGLIISLCITLSAFEWSSNEGKQTRLKGSLEEEPYLMDVFIEPQQKQDNQKSISTQKSTKTPDKIKQVDKQQNPKDVDTVSFEDLKIGDSNETKPIIEKITITATQKVHKEYEVDFSPEFPGGQDALRAFVNSELKTPQITIDKGVPVKIYLSFVVNSKGEVIDVTFEKGKASKQLKKEAIRTLRSMPNWKPALKDGKPVSVKQFIPINIVVK